MKQKRNGTDTLPATRPTIRDVADKAGVSPAAVSLTLSGRGRVADETRQRILSVVAELNYVLPKRKRQSADVRSFTVSAGSGSEYRPRRAVNMQQEVDFLRGELDQRQQEGYDTDSIQPLADSILDNHPTLEDIETLWRRLEDLEPRADFPFQEGSTWEEITATRPARSRHLEARFSADQLYNRLYGGLLGRAAGCMLGRPLELLGDFEDVQEFLERGGAFPLTDYVPEILPHPAKYAGYTPDVKHYLRGHIRYAARDDDLDYTVLNLLVVENYGGDFTSEHIAESWLRYLAVNATYTAERVAYSNLVNQYGPPDSALYRNPYREFIGAQIRADMFGYIAPGNPDLAAQRAYRDARVSHTKNGIYGSMFVSAMIAAAFVLPDVESVIRTGLEVIPENSRMASAVRDTIEQVHNSQNWQDVAAYIGERFADHDPIHVLPNICLVVLALLWGQGDFERTITTAAMSGVDCDCNAATTGSIVGTLIGASRLPERWTAPLNDELETWISGQGRQRISDLARRALNLARGSLNAPSRKAHHS